MGTQGAPCPQHEDERVPLSLPLQFWEPERAAEGGGPRSAPQLSPPSPTSSVGIGGESALQSEMGAARGGNSPGCRGRMELGSSAAAPGERKCCGVAWSLPVVLHPASPPCQVPQLSLRTGRRCSPEPPPYCGTMPAGMLRADPGGAAWFSWLWYALC